MSLPIPTLDALGLKYGTDKGPLNHNYLRHYQRLFEPLRNESLRLLEIGVFNGASVKMWQEYFPNGTIFGIDCEERCRQYEDDRIEIFIGGQADPQFIDWVARIGAPSLDIIIDDGSHWGKDQRESFELLYPYLNPGGLYCIEDVQTSYRWGGENFVDWVKGKLDTVVYPGRGPSMWGDPRRSLDWGGMKDHLDEFTRTTKCVSFYSGMIVFEKFKVGEELR